jgi:CHAT domain-containing protein
MEMVEQTAAENSGTAGLARARNETVHTYNEKLAELHRDEQQGVLTADERKTREAEIETLRVEANELEEQLFAADPAYKAAVSPASLKDLQTALHPGEGYLKVMLLANRGYGILVTPAGARPYAIELTTADARDMAAKLRAPFDQVSSGRLAPFSVPLAREMYKKLLGPIDAQLADVHALIYQPDPTLIGLPLGVLVADDASLGVMRKNIQTAINTRTPLSYRGVGWVARRIDTSVSVSTNAFVATRGMRASKAAKPFLGFGDPVVADTRHAFASVAAPPAWVRASGFDYCAGLRGQLLGLPALPETAAEVTKVAGALGASGNVMLGADFTTARIRRLDQDHALQQYRVLYFATHGLLPQANGCLQPSLVTSTAADSDGLLGTREIRKLNTDAELVVLSACDTGAGDGGGGSELGGLVASFTRAGARNLLVSNWKVDSVATEMLMTDLFTSKAPTQGLALKAAEADFFERPDGYSHPFYWAAFSIIGDGGRPTPGL